jgi:hypothetical protein
MNNQIEKEKAKAKAKYDAYMKISYAEHNAMYGSSVQDKNYLNLVWKMCLNFIYSSEDINDFCDELLDTVSATEHLSLEDAYYALSEFLLDTNLTDAPLRGGKDSSDSVKALHTALARLGTKLCLDEENDDEGPHYKTVLVTKH